jgi:hypothetical protein
MLALRFDFVTSFYVILPLTVVGFICNLLIVVVLARNKTMNRTTRFLLQMLALADIMFYVLLPLLEVIELLYFTYDVKKFMGFDLSQIMILVNAQVLASETIVVWTAVIVTYHRYVAIRKPLSARQYIAMSRARTAIAVVWIGSVIIYTPAFWVVTMDDADRFNSLNALRILFTVTALMLPVSLTMFLNIRLIVVTRRSSAFLRQQILSRDKNDNRTANRHLRVTVTLIVIVTVYLVCQLPVTTVQILRSSAVVMFDQTSCSHFPFKLYLLIAYSSSQCLSVTSSLAECVIYCIMGTSFRQSLIRELLCRRNNGK